MVERITRLDRRIGVLVVALLVTMVIGCTTWAVTSFMGAGEVEDEAFETESIPEGAEDWMQPSPDQALGPDGEPVPQATLIARAVQATIEAMPTPTPEPTPDIAATLQAELAANRERVAPVVMLNPLDLEVDRDPYLTPAELAYFREMGPRIWAYTRVWLHLQRVLSVDVVDWDLSVLQHDLGTAQAVLESAPDRPAFPRGGASEVDPLVRAYADSLEAGMIGVRRAVVRLSDAEEILSLPVGHAERETLIRIIRDVEELLADFDDSMSAYGCSVCGELFRREGP